MLDDLGGFHFSVKTDRLLAIDQWNDRRLEYRDERQLIDQLIEDLQADIQNTSSSNQVLKIKEVSLISLQTALNTDQIGVSNREFLEAVVAGADFGWNQGRPMSVTFEELRNSGSVGERPKLAVLYRSSTAFSS